MRSSYQPSAPWQVWHELRTPTGVEEAFPSNYFPSSSPVKKDLKRAKLDTDFDETKVRVSRERNRVHAQRTRTRKRELLETLKGRILALKAEHAALKQSFEFHSTAICLLSLSQTAQHENMASQLTKIEPYFSATAAASRKYFDGSDFTSESLDVPETVDALTSQQLPLPASVSIPDDHWLQTKDEREQLRRERNRLHARRARLRKKLMLERSQEIVDTMRMQNDQLREHLYELMQSIYGSNSPGLPVPRA